VAYEEDDGNDGIVNRVSCIMPHRCGENGCKHSSDQTCYYCPHNPFYELLVYSDRPVIRMMPYHAPELVIKVGTLLLLDIECESFRTLVKPSQISNSTKKRKRSRISYDANGEIIAPVTDDEDDTVVNNNRFIQVRLDIPRNYTPVHGKLYVSIHVRYQVSSSTEDMRSIYVNPEDLMIPTDDKETERAHKCFYVV
jgi:hypothetical protein